MGTLTIQVPHGSGPGSLVGFMAPNGAQMQAEVPDGVVEGETFQVQVPSSQGVQFQGFQGQLYQGQMSQVQTSQVQESEWMTVDSAMPQPTETRKKKKQKKERHLLLSFGGKAQLVAFPTTDA